jgi:hypothetical protein
MQLSWTEQTRRSYLDFVRQIDNLTYVEVIWQPFTDILHHRVSRPVLSGL